jgi:hypothetical protein
MIANERNNPNFDWQHWHLGHLHHLCYLTAFGGYN